MYGGMDVKVHAFLSSALDVGERSAGPSQRPPLQNNSNLGGTQKL
jgi:hypothetical protein